MIDLCLAELNKPDTNELIFQSLFLELVSRYPGFKQIYTDGSKTADAVGSASVTGKDYGKVFRERLPSCSSVYSAELKALFLALKWFINPRRNSWLFFQILCLL